MKQHDTYTTVRTIHFEGGVARIHIPDLTSEERQQRISIISKAAGDLVRSMPSKNN